MAWLLLIPTVAAAVVLFILLKPPALPYEAELSVMPETEPVPVSLPDADNVPAIVAVRPAPALVNPTMSGD